MVDSLIVDGIKYSVGDVLYTVNIYNQQFTYRIVRVWYGSDTSKACLFGQRREWPNPEIIDFDSIIRSRHFPKGE